MAILVTERPRQPFKSEDDSDGRTVYTGTRIFDVSGVPDGPAAEAALFSAKGVRRGSEHPQNPAAICQSIDNDITVPGDSYVVTAEFTSRNGSDSTLEEPPTIRYEPYSYTEQSFADLDGIPFVNTAGFYFEGGFPLEKHGVILTIGKWEASYNAIKCLTYMGKCNSGNFSWPDGNHVTDGQAKCLGIFQGEKSSVSARVRNEYRFDLRADGWKKNVLDQGGIGYTTIGGSARAGVFVGKGGTDGEIIPNVLLDGTGFPISGNIWVQPPKENSGEPTDPPAASPSHTLVNGTLSTDDFKVLSFRACVSVDFGGLGI